MPLLIQASVSHWSALRDQGNANIIFEQNMIAERPPYTQGGPIKFSYVVNSINPIIKVKKINNRPTTLRSELNGRDGRCYFGLREKPGGGQVLNGMNERQRTKGWFLLKVAIMDWPA